MSIASTRRKKTIKAVLIILFLLLIACLIGHCGNDQNNTDLSNTESEVTFAINEDDEYTTAEDVAEYIHTYHKLPSNYMLEEEAMDKGWKSNECPGDYGFMIGGKKFGNHEGLLPKGETYYECDVDYDGNARGERRLVFTKNGAVYYTEDHYESFEQLFQED